MTEPSALGKRILARRKEQGLTQEQLGRELCVSAQAVSKWENGESLPDIGVFPVLCKVLASSADMLLGIDGELGIETLGTKLARRIGSLESATQRSEALLVALSFLNPVRAGDHPWNGDRNIAYELDRNRLTGISFWSRKGLVCFARGEVLHKEGQAVGQMAIIRTLIGPDCWEIAQLLLDGPKTMDELLTAAADGTAESLQVALGKLMEAGLLVQDKDGYRLEKSQGLLLVGVLRALCLESLRDGGRGIHVNSRLGD